MSTLTVPATLTSPRDDALHFHKALKGFGCDTAAIVSILAHRDATQRSLIQHEYRTMYHEDLSKRLSSELSGDVKVANHRFGCDTAAIVSILAHRDATQRSLIQHEYRTMYHEDLSKRLSSELSGDVKRAVLLWLHDPAGRDATIVRQALHNDINLKAATEVICSRTSSQIQHFKQVYYSLFGAYVEHDIELQATGDHKKLLLAYITTSRYEGPEIDRAMVEHDAKALYKAGEKKLGTDEKTFIRIFTERSRAHLAAVDSAYHSMYGNSLKKAVKSETSGLFEFGLVTILQCAQNPGKYFAKVLHKAMKGMGTNDTTLIRVIVTRTEIDMQYIKAEYRRKHGKSLNDAVHSETSSHYRTFLLSLLGPNH